MASKLMRLYVTPEFITRFCIETDPIAIQCIGNPLPEDTRVISGAWCEERQSFVMTLESGAFAPVADGDLIPEFPEIRFKFWDTTIAEGDIRIYTPANRL